jgi:hypothetical protein
MALANVDAVLERAEYLIGSTWANLSNDSKEAVVAQALDELGMTLPEDNSQRCYWIIERTKRHGLYQFVVTEAERFRYKQIYLQQKFDNYFRLITHADERLAEAIESDMSGIFPDDIVDGEMFALYGFMYNPAGFVYDQLGRDLTYVTD